MLFIGLDHSLTAFGLAAVRPDWELDFHRVRRKTLKTRPEDGPLVARRALLVTDVVEWIKRRAASLDVSLTDVRVFIEGGIFNSHMSETIRSQERLVGVVEHELHGVGLRVEVAEQRSVRTTFMGKSAGGGRGAGDAAQELLKAVAPETQAWDEAELDAFLVANHALSMAGEAFVTCAPAVEPEKPARKPRRVA